MLTTFQRMSAQVAARSPYPLALQGLLSLVLLATPLNALVAGFGGHPLRFWAIVILMLFQLLICSIVPIRRLRCWQQLAVLVVMSGIVTLASAIIPVTMLTYVLLTIVLQAIYLFRPWIWIPFACLVWLGWNGTLFLVSSNLLDWLQSNLTLAFPATCILIAAIVYARQHRHHAQVQQLLDQMQYHYDTLLVKLRDVQQHAALEERHRLMQMITSDISSALANTEQSVVTAIGQAQTNLGKFQATMAQTRLAASAAIERLRGSVAALRGEHQQYVAYPALGPAMNLVQPVDDILTVRSRKALTWILPLVFVTLALPLAQFYQPFDLIVIGKLLLFCGILLILYVFTQHLRHPLLIQAGLAAQSVAVLTLVTATQTMPLLFGLLLVMWQIALRLSTVQIVTVVLGVYTSIGFVLAWALPVTDDYSTYLLVMAVVGAVVVGLLGTARRQLSRRRADETRLAHLATLIREIEQQEAEVRTLAIAAEHTHLARELHDDLGSRLVLLNVQLQLVEDLIEDDPAAALEQLVTTREQLSVIWSSIGTIAAGKSLLDGTTLAPALQALILPYQSRVRPHIELAITGALTALSAEVAHTIYRVVQEGLTNACKYADAHHIVVTILCEAGQVQTCVRDDGRGVAPSADLTHCGGANTPGKFGIAGLRERALLLGGNVDAGPLPEGGFGLALTLPLQEALR
ncbi:MAG: histidine kinase [Chloroflexales bacterium]|nr:histidine kinase [Chloroflexales bacterium]